MPEYSRRTFLLRGGAVTAALGAAPLVGLGGVDRALAASTRELSAERRATYAAVVEAVALAGTTRVVGARVAHATDAFASLYRQTSPDGRGVIDEVLDLVEAGPGGQAFSRLDKHARLRQLRGWIAGAERAEFRGKRWRAVAPTAVGFAAAPFYPDTPGYPQPLLEI